MSHRRRALQHRIVVQVGVPRDFPRGVLHRAHHHVLRSAHGENLRFEPTRSVIRISVLASRDNRMVVARTQQAVKLVCVLRVREAEELRRNEHVETQRLVLTP